jgi:hypothetical protein
MVPVITKVRETTPSKGMTVNERKMPASAQLERKNWSAHHRDVFKKGFAGINRKQERS